MFKNIQKNLLLRHPLLWNVKFVPVLAVTLIINIIFFVYGYIYGSIDFTSLAENNYRSVSGVTFFFSIIIAILTLILWLVFYFRNNGFKSFYPKGKNQLYKEWLLILILCILNCNYYHSFEYAYKLRARHYFSEEEAVKRMDIISRAALFIEGSYRPVYQYETDKTLYETDNYNAYDEYAIETPPLYENDTDTIAKDSVCYYGILYYHTSFINKNTTKFSIQGYERDSINEFTVKRWLYDQKKDSVKKVMDNFLALAKEHNNKANISSEKWMDLVYHPTQYTTYLEVGRDSINLIDDGNDYTEYNKSTADTINNYVKRINHGYVAFPKHHVPLTQLELSYTRISEAWNSPYDIFEISAILYFAFALSLLIFSFRVTSGKSWLISGIALAITGLITFIFTMIARHAIGLDVSEEILFTSIWFGIIVLLVIWFFRIYGKKQSKKLSYILVNVLLWLLPAVLPIIWFGVYGYMSYSNHYYEYDSIDYKYYVANDPRYPIYQWMQSNVLLMFMVNLAIIVLYMFLFTRAVKKWKGIAEA